MLDARQLEHYRRNGYLLLENAIDPARVARLRAVIVRLQAQAAGVAHSNTMFDLAPGHSAQTPRVRRLKNPHLHDPAFAELARCAQIVDPVAQLLGGSVRFDHAKLNFKPPGVDAAIQWHQDWAFYPHTNDDLLAVGVMIEDCTADNGPLLVIPGSHRGPVYDHHHDGLFAGGIDPALLGTLPQQAQALTGPAGSITLHHVRTLHASANNATATSRPLLLFSYAAVDAFPVFAEVDLAEFDARILRGEATLSGRMEALPFRIPQPSTASDDSIFDNQQHMLGAE